MKTFIHNIEGVDYTLSIKGTVGLQILAQIIVPDEKERYSELSVSSCSECEGTEKKSLPTAKWLMALIYAAFITSNPKAGESVDFVQFMMSFSASEFNDAVEWYYEAYAEREGFTPYDGQSRLHNTEDPSSKNA